MQKHIMQVMFQLRLYEYGLNSSAYSELYAAYEYLVTLSVTQVECERSFSTLKFILRSNSGQEKLEALMLTYMEKHMVSDISNEEIIDHFANSSSALRRLLMP
jgi:hypothetical protein